MGIFGYSLGAKIKRRVTSDDIGAYQLFEIITGTASSATTDFSSVKVGDYIFEFTTSGGNARAGLVVTNGTCPFTGASGNIYQVFRLNKTI